MITSRRFLLVSWLSIVMGWPVVFARTQAMALQSVELKVDWRPSFSVFRMLFAEYSILTRILLFSFSISKFWTISKFSIKSLGRFC